jgi:hypothetical protein
VEQQQLLWAEVERQKQREDALGDADMEVL